MGGQRSPLALNWGGRKVMEVRERQRLEKLIPEIEEDIGHIRANIATLKARKHEKKKLIEEIKEMLR